MLAVLHRSSMLIFVPERNIFSVYVSVLLLIYISSNSFFSKFRLYDLLDLSISTLYDYTAEKDSNLSAIKSRNGDDKVMQWSF